MSYHKSSGNACGSVYQSLPDNIGHTQLLPSKRLYTYGLPLQIILANRHVLATIKPYNNESADVMRSIAIVDDDATQVAYLSKLTGEWAAARGEKCAVYTFASAEAFLFAWPEQRFDICLLDVQMGAMNGVTLARTIRARGDDAALVFITGVSEYMQEGFGVAALHYLLKPVQVDKLYTCLDKACLKALEAACVVLTSVEGETLRLPVSSIIYAEAFAHTVQLRHKQGMVEVRLRIGELEEQLTGGPFVRCHRSYVVGLAHIARLGKTGLWLDDGTCLPVSRRSMAEVNAAFVGFYRKGDE